MQSKRSGYKISLVTENSLRISTSPGKRIIYLVCFITLFTAFLLNFKSSDAFGEKNLPATLVYLLITAVCFFSTLWGHKLMLERNSRRVVEERGFPGIPFRKKEYDFSEAPWEIAMVYHPLLEKPGLHNRRTGLLSAFSENRGAVYRILLRSDRGTCSLAETTYREEAEYISKTVSAFLGLRTREEKIL